MMDCEQCNNNVEQLRQMYKNLRMQFDIYLDRKEEQHPLNELIEGITDSLETMQGHPNVLKKQLERLRYESIKWSHTVFNPDGRSINVRLKEAGHADWIVD